MVKKSFFARLFGREGEPQPAPGRESPRGGVKVAARNNQARRPTLDFGSDERDASDSATASQGTGTGTGAMRSDAQARTATETRPAVERTPPGPPSRGNESLGSGGPGGALAAQVAKPVEATAMARQEEMALKLQEGFSGISTVLRGLDTKIEQQTKTSEELIVSVRRIPELMKDVPDASRAGLELLNTISRILEYQGRTTAELLDKMRDLPGGLEAMEQRFQEQISSIAVASREADRSARETQRSLSTAFDGVKRAVEEVQSTNVHRQESLVEEMRRHRKQQDERVDALLKKMSNSTKVVIFLLVVVIFALLVAVYGTAR